MKTSNWLMIGNVDNYSSSYFASFYSYEKVFQPKLPKSQILVGIENHN